MTSKQVCRRLGITLRKLQWWCDNKVVPFSYDDRHDRQFDNGQVVAAALAKELRDKKVPLRAVRKMVASKHKNDFLVVCRRSYLWCTRDRLIQCVGLAQGPCLVVSLQDLRRLYG